MAEYYTGSSGGYKGQSGEPGVSTSAIIQRIRQQQARAAEVKALKMKMWTSIGAGGLKFDKTLRDYQLAKTQDPSLGLGKFMMNPTVGGALKKKAADQIIAGTLEVPGFFNVKRWNPMTWGKNSEPVARNKEAIEKSVDATVPIVEGSNEFGSFDKDGNMTHNAAGEEVDVDGNVVQAKEVAKIKPVDEFDPGIDANEPLGPVPFMQSEEVESLQPIGETTGDATTVVDQEEVQTDFMETFTDQPPIEGMDFANLDREVGFADVPENQRIMYPSMRGKTLEDLKNIKETDVPPSGRSIDTVGGDVDRAISESGIIKGDSNVVPTEGLSLSNAFKLKNPSYGGVEYDPNKFPGPTDTPGDAALIGETVGDSDLPYDTEGDSSLWQDTPEHQKYLKENYPPSEVEWLKEGAPWGGTKVGDPGGPDPETGAGFGSMKSALDEGLHSGAITQAEYDAAIKIQADSRPQMLSNKELEEAKSLGMSITDSDANLIDTIGPKEKSGLVGAYQREVKGGKSGYEFYDQDELPVLTGDQIAKNKTLATELTDRTGKVIGSVPGGPDEYKETIDLMKTQYPLPGGDKDGPVNPETILERQGEKNKLLKEAELNEIDKALEEGWKEPLPKGGPMIADANISPKFGQQNIERDLNSAIESDTSSSFGAQNIERDLNAATIKDAAVPDASELGDVADATKEAGKGILGTGADVLGGLGDISTLADEEVGLEDAKAAASLAKSGAEVLGKEAAAKGIGKAMPVINVAMAAKTLTDKDSTDVQKAGAIMSTAGAVAATNFWNPVGWVAGALTVGGTLLTLFGGKSKVKRSIRAATGYTGGTGYKQSSGRY